MGFGLVALILIGDSFDMLFSSFRTSGHSLNRNYFRIIGIYFLVLAVSFVSISVKNPKTAKYYNLGYLKRVLFVDDLFQETKNKNLQSHNTDTITKHEQIISENTPDVSTVFNFFNWLKEKLNNSLFDTKGALTVSGDFLSPFDSLNRLYVIISLLFGCLSLFSVFFFIRPFRLSFLLPLMGVLYIGCGYLRMVGYIPIVAASIWFIAGGCGALKMIKNDAWGYYTFAS